MPPIIDFWSDLPAFREVAYVFLKVVFKGFGFMVGLLLACWGVIHLTFLSDWLMDQFFRRRP